jgi:chromosomal replication initiation ATPase DnaA
VETLGLASACVVDDIAPGVQEEELLHLINLAQENRASILLLSRYSPVAWGVMRDDLQSRLRALPHAAVSAPDDQTLAALLLKHFADRQLDAGADVLDYLLSHMERSFAGAARLVEQLDVAALAAHRPVTLKLARDLLQPPE